MRRQCVFLSPDEINHPTNSCIRARAARRRYQLCHASENRRRAKEVWVQHGRLQLVCRLLCLPEEQYRNTPHVSRSQIVSHSLPAHHRRHPWNSWAFWSQFCDSVYVTQLVHEVCSSRFGGSPSNAGIPLTFLTILQSHTGHS